MCNFANTYTPLLLSTVVKYKVSYSASICGRPVKTFLTSYSLITVLKLVEVSHTVCSHVRGPIFLISGTVPPLVSDP